MEMRTRITLIIFSLTLTVLSQNPVEYRGESINYLNNNGLKQGLWKLYTPNDDRAPKGRTYLACKFKDGKLEQSYRIRKGKKTLIEIIPIANEKKASFKATKGSKELSGTISREKDKVKFYDSVGNEYIGEDRAWLLNNSTYLPMHYGGALGAQRSINRIYIPENVQGEKGKIFVTFTVDANGYIIDPKIGGTRKITNDIHGLLEKEALRIISLLPRMQPGFQYYRFVKTKYTIPVNF